MARVSIVIPAYNAAAYLPASLDSVLAQTFEDWEILLVDDGSTDHTRELIEARMPEFRGRLRYIYQKNRGLPAARNTALKHAAGQYIAILDADDVWLERRLERAVAALDQHPEAGLVHGPVRRIDASGRVIGEPARPPRRYLSGDIAEDIYTRRAHILCPTVTFRASCLRVTGLFDETMRATEDRDLWFRIASHYAVLYLDEILAHYRISPGAMSQNLDRMLNAQMQFVEKHRFAPRVSAASYRLALAGIYRERGDALFNRGELGSAIECYAKSVKNHPFDFKNVYMLARAVAQALIVRLRLPGSAGHPKSA